MDDEPVFQPERRLPMTGSLEAWRTHGYRQRPRKCSTPSEASTQRSHSAGVLERQSSAAARYPPAYVRALSLNQSQYTRQRNVGRSFAVIPSGAASSAMTVRSLKQSDF